MPASLAFFGAASLAVAVASAEGASASYREAVAANAGFAAGGGHVALSEFNCAALAWVADNPAINAVSPGHSNADDADAAAIKACAGMWCCTILCCGPSHLYLTCLMLDVRGCW